MANKLLTEEDIKAINDGKFDRPLNLEETAEYFDSFGTMTSEELLEWGKKKITELWNEKYGNL